MLETICDLANQRLRARLPTPAHRLEAHAAKHDDLDYLINPRPVEAVQNEADAALADLPGVTRLDPTGLKEEVAPPSNQAFLCPVAHTGVFVDDFIQLGQGGPRRMRALRNHLLKAINEVLVRPRVDEPH